MHPTQQEIRVASHASRGIRRTCQIDVTAQRLIRTTHTRKGEAKVVKLRLDSIRLNSGTQTRAHIDDGTVAEYAEAMVRGDRFPPVVVFQNGGDVPMDSIG